MPPKFEDLRIEKQLLSSSPNNNPLTKETLKSVEIATEKADWNQHVKKHIWHIFESL